MCGALLPAHCRLLNQGLQSQNYVPVPQGDPPRRPVRSECWSDPPCASGHLYGDALPPVQIAGQLFSLSQPGLSRQPGYPRRMPRMFLVLCGSTGFIPPSTKFARPPTRPLTRMSLQWTLKPSSTKEAGTLTPDVCRTVFSIKWRWLRADHGWLVADTACSLPTCLYAFTLYTGFTSPFFRRFAFSTEWTVKGSLSLPLGYPTQRTHLVRASRLQLHRLWLVGGSSLLPNVEESTAAARNVCYRCLLCLGDIGELSSVGALCVPREDIVWRSPASPSQRKKGRTTMMHVSHSHGFLGLLAPTSSILLRTCVAGTKK